MKLFAATIFAIAAAEDKKVPPRHPLSRLAKLEKFAVEWVNDNLDVKQAANWVPKFERNAARMETRFSLCGFYDDESEHGGPARKRREVDDQGCELGDEDCLSRYDKNNPMRGIQQITKGFTKWAERYIADCGKQPVTQVDRMARWYGQMLSKLAENQA